MVLNSVISVGELLQGDVGAVDLARRRRLAQYGVDHYGKPRIGPVVDQPGRFAVGQDQRHARQPVVLERGDEGGSDAVVAAVLVPDTDHHGSCHCRSTVRSRKWVEQEMHGS